jgi:hypothetical protein
MNDTIVTVTSTGLQPVRRASGIGRSWGEHQLKHVTAELLGVLFGRPIRDSFRRNLPRTKVTRPGPRREQTENYAFRPRFHTLTSHGPRFGDLGEDKREGTDV